MRIIKASKEFFLDLFFPKACFGCQQEGDWLCGQCIANITVNKQSACPFCNQPAKYSLTCDQCRKDHYLDGCYVMFDYHQLAIKQFLKSLKYQSIKETEMIIKKLWCKYFEKSNFSREIEISDFSVLAVPLHKKRLYRRGFNQSSLIAKPLIELFGLEDLSKYCLRSKNTVHQASLSRTERLKNLNQAFELLEIDKFNNKSILLIDDVATTATTLDQLAKILKQAGCLEVIGLVVASNKIELLDSGKFRDKI